MSFSHRFTRARTHSTCQQGTHNSKLVMLLRPTRATHSLRFSISYNASKLLTLIHLNSCRETASNRRPVCRGEGLLSNIAREDGSCVNDEGRKLAEEISKFLPQDQEHAATLGVSSMILASLCDAIGKVFGAEHSGRARGMGLGVSPSSAFMLHSELNLPGSPGSISDAIEERIGGLVKQVDILQEKLKGYDEIKERIVDVVKQVDTLQEKLNGYDEMKAQLARTQDEFWESKAKLLRIKFRWVASTNSCRIILVELPVFSQDALKVIFT